MYRPPAARGQGKEGDCILAGRQEGPLSPSLGVEGGA